MEQVTIIGAGPAGIACAIAFKHLGINPLLIEKNKIGGLISNAFLVRNYPGMEQVTGKTLVKKFVRQLNSFKIKPLKQEVLEINFKKHFIVKTNKQKINSHFVVLASGTTAKSLPNKLISDIKNKTFYEVSDFPRTTNKIIAVIGAGDASFDYALSLSAKNKVIILNKGHKIKANGFLRKRVSLNKKIHYIENFKIGKINFQDKKIVLQGKKPVMADYLFVAIGRKPNYPALGRNAVKNNNFYLIGDIKNGRLRQSSVSAGDGVKCAMEIYEKIRN